MPFRSIAVKAPLFMRHKGLRIYHIYRRDDADSGVLRQYAYTFDPVDGSDDLTDGHVTFDVRNLSTWKPPAHPPSLSGDGDTPANRRAWKRFESDGVEEKAIKAAIRGAIDKGEVGPTKDGGHQDKRQAIPKGERTTCSLCGNPCDARKAHLHQGKLVGDECCWDERLKASE